MAIECEQFVPINLIQDTRKESTTPPSNIWRKNQPVHPLELMVTDRITTRDLTPIYELQEAGFAVYIHGSIVTIGRLKPNSDIDFAIIGDLKNIPDKIKNEFFPELDTSLYGTIDYISVAKMAENGRKMSLHLENPEFRLNYPAKPYALEYRSSMRQEAASGRKTYLLGGVNDAGDIHAFLLTCPQVAYGNGVISYTPQTGIYLINDQRATSVDNPSVEYGIKSVSIFDKSLEKPKSSTEDIPKFIMFFGLELNKMSEDVPFDSLATTAQDEEYTVWSLWKSLELIRDFTGADPALTYLNHSIQIRELMYSIKNGAPVKISPDFSEALYAKLVKSLTQQKIICA